MSGEVQNFRFMLGKCVETHGECAPWRPGVPDLKPGNVPHQVEQNVVDKEQSRQFYIIDKDIPERLDIPA